MTLVSTCWASPPSKTLSSSLGKYFYVYVLCALQATKAQARAQSLAAKLKAHRRSSGESALLLQVETLQEDKRSAEAHAEGLRTVRCSLLSNIGLCFCICNLNGMRA